ncbi:MAG: hypothetical protein V2A58_03755, partial [Planctomycetota bacterium]
MTLSESILESCRRRLSLSPELVGLLTKDQNALSIEDRSRLERELEPHVPTMHRVIADLYAVAKKEDVHNVHAWAATIVAESNRAGYMTELDQLVLRLINDPSFDSGETERV